MTLSQAAEAGIIRLRLPEWLLPGDHIEIHITSEGRLGPWVKLYSCLNERLSMDNPCEVLVTTLSQSDWKQYIPSREPLTDQQKMAIAVELLKGASVAAGSKLTWLSIDAALKILHPSS